MEKPDVTVTFCGNPWCWNASMRDGGAKGVEAAKAFLERHGKPGELRTGERVKLALAETCSAVAQRSRGCLNNCRNAPTVMLVDEADGRTKKHTAGTPEEITAQAVAFGTET